MTQEPLAVDPAEAPAYQVKSPDGGGVSRFFCLWTVLFVLLCGGSLVAQAQVTTLPEGFITLSIPAAPSATSPSVTPICVPLHDLFESGGTSRGTVVGLTSNTLADSGASWSPGALSNAATPCFIRMTSGTSAGRTLQILTTPANTATTVTVNNQGMDLTTSGIAAGDAYQVISGDTLSALFGTSPQSGILSGTSPDTADNVQVWNGSTWQVFYYHSTNNRWQQKGISTSANNFVIRPDAGLMFVRRALSSLSIPVWGTVPSSDIRTLYTKAGGTFLANGFPVAVTLQTLNIQAQAGWISGTDPTACDTVQFWNGSAWQIFYYHSANSRWQQKGINASANSFSIPAGKPFMVFKLGSSSGTQTVVQSLPYALN